MAYKTYDEELKDRWRNVKLPLWVKLSPLETLEMVKARLLLDYETETDLDRKISMSREFAKIDEMISAIILQSIPSKMTDEQRFKTMFHIDTNEIRDRVKHAE